MIIDAHQHFWRYNAERDGWITAEMSVLRRDYLPQHLLPELAVNGVHGSIAVQASQSEAETRFLLELAERHDEIAGVVGWVDLCDAQVRERLAYFSQFGKLRGFRHIVQSEPDDFFLLRDDFCRGISALRDFHFTYDILIYPKQLAAAIELVHRFPEQPFVIDHMAKPLIRAGELHPWAEQMRAMAAGPNVWCKLSGLVTEAEWHKWTPEQFRPYFEIVLDSFGPDRLMYGSDWPVCLLSASYAQALQVVTQAIGHLGAGDREKILGVNAAAFYGLKTSPHRLAE